MSEITSGSLAYTTPRPFESPSATVTLGFTIDDQTGAEAFIASVGQLARRQAHGALIEGAIVVSQPTPEPVRRTRGPNKLKEPTEPQTENPFGSGPHHTDSSQVSFGEATLGGGPTAPAASDGVADENFAFSAGEIVEITDVDLMTALNRKAAELGGATEINKLLGEYVPKGGNPRQIEQIKRHEFLDKIHALK